MDVSSNTVVVTGFGAFRQHLVNSSWEAAKEMNFLPYWHCTADSNSALLPYPPFLDLALLHGEGQEGYRWSSDHGLTEECFIKLRNQDELLKLGLGKDVNLHIIELPVVYQKAKERVCKAWETLNPQLMIHLGLAATSKGTIILEQCGKNKGYKDMDVCGFCPEDHCCLLEGPERIESIINMKRVWKNLRMEGVDVIFSRDAGRYLCNYVYYTSLYYGNRRAAFIHLPPLTKWVTAEFLGNVLRKIILEVLKQCKSENM